LESFVAAIWGAGKKTPKTAVKQKILRGVDGRETWKKSKRKVTEVGKEPRVVLRNGIKSGMNSRKMTVGQTGEGAHGKINGLRHVGKKRLKGCKTGDCRIIIFGTSFRRLG